MQRQLPSLFGDMMWSTFYQEGRGGQRHHWRPGGRFIAPLLGWISCQSGIQHVFAIQVLPMKQGCSFNDTRPKNLTLSMLSVTLF